MGRYENLVHHLNLSPRLVYNQSQQEGKVGTWLYACDNMNYWWSDQVYRIYGLPRNTPLSPALFTDQVYPEDAAQVQESFSKVLSGKRCHIVHRICVAGKIKWLEQRARFYPSKGDSPAYIVGMVRDVTAFKEEEARLAAKRANFAAITNYLAETTDTTNLRAIVSSVKRTLRKRIDVAVIAVFIRQGDRVERVIPASMDTTQTFLFQDIHDYVGYRAALEGKHQFCAVEDYPNLLGREALQSMGGTSITAFPIHHSGKPIGALSVVKKHSGPLNLEESEFCRTICGYLSNQLNSALLCEQLKAELALRVRLESDREIIFNESVDFISIIDHEGRFSQINPAFAARLGQEPQELIGHSVFDFIHPEDRSFALRTFHDLPRFGVIRGFCNRFLCGNDQIGYLENNLKYRPETKSTIAIARDVTDQRRIEADNTHLKNTLISEKLKSEFFAGLSHEFKTPLNIILSSLDLVQMKGARELPQWTEQGYARFLSYASQNCYRLLRLTSNLLDASRIDCHYYRLTCTSHALTALLEDIVASADPYAGAHGLTLSFRPWRKEEAWAKCDVDSIDRILLNLISNAIKNTPSGGTVQVLLSEEGDCYQVAVEDNGVGISTEALPTIFDQFRTEHNPLSGKQEGSGLGLSLVKSLVELQNGAVSVESQVGRGSRFSFTLSKCLPPARSEPSDHSAVELRQEARDSRTRLELSGLE